MVYPGLPSHPEHELAKRQQHGFGAMITFYCVGTREQSAIILRSVSLYDCESSLFHSMKYCPPHEHTSLLAASCLLSCRIAWRS